jgi:septin family protein
MVPCCVLSLQVTVIPVIAKADTMTEEELAEYRQEVRGR